MTVEPEYQPAQTSSQTGPQSCESCLQYKFKIHAMNKGPKKSKKILFLSQRQKNDAAITFKKDCSIRWNLGWVCWKHGQLDLKINGAYQAHRYLIGEIVEAGGNFLMEPGYSEESAPETHCCGGAQYQGGVPFGSVQTAVKYLKRYFDIRACPGNTGLNGHPTCNQRWIDAQ